MNISKEIIAKAVVEILGLEKVKRDELIASNDLTYYGLDSMSAVELVVKLENEFDCEIQETDLLLDNLKNIDGIFAVFKKYCQM